MSLINQMLRDLQQQKKPASPAKPPLARPNMLERFPLLPRPLVVGGVTLGLLFFIWWLAGALSDVIFPVEPSTPAAESSQLATAQPYDPAAAAGAGAVEENPLTLAERMAEPPVAEPPGSKSEQAVEAVNEQPVKAVVAAQPTRKKSLPIKPKVVVAERPASSPAPPVSKKTPSKMIRPSQAQPQPVAKVAPQLHPDTLPGAVVNRSPNPETMGIRRPSALPATTPYGKAEEAFLDGRWALEQKRDNLAVHSLLHALTLYPGHLQARELLTKTYVSEGKSSEAMLLLAEGLDVAPDYIPFKKSYVKLLVAQSDYDAAAKVMLKGGLPSVEADPEAHVLLASLYQHLGEFFLSAQTYRNLLVAWPQTGAFWVGLGSALEGQGLPKDAVECYQRALKTKNLRQDLSHYAKKRLSLLG